MMNLTEIRNRDSYQPSLSTVSIELKVLWAFCFCLLVTSLIMMMYHPSQGYEPSIYKATPPTVWILLEICIALGIGSAIWSALGADTSNTNAWLVGFSVVIIASMIIIMTPFLRGYTGAIRSDMMIHVGRIVDILNNDRIPLYDRPSSSLLYPAPIILLSQVSLVTGVEPFVLIQFTALVTYLLRILFIYLLAKTIFTQTFPIALCMLASGVLLLSTLNYETWPTVLGITISLLILWLYLQVITRNTVGFRIALIVVSMLTVFVHPLTCIILLFCLIVTEIYRRMKRGKIAIKPERLWLQSGQSRVVLTGTLLVIFIVLVSWLMYNQFFWELSVLQFIKLLTLFGSGAYAQSINHLGTVDLDFVDVLLLLVKIHGHHIIYLALTVTGGVTIIKKAIDSDLIAKRLMMIVTFICAQVVIMISVFFGGSGTVTYWRVMAPIVFSAPLILAYLGANIHWKYVRDRKDRSYVNVYFKIIVVSFLFSVYNLGIFSFFPSPYTYRLNQQISSAELHGMDWFVQHKNESIPIDSLTKKFVFGAVLEGYKSVDRAGGPGNRKWGETLEVPEHFDYSAERKASLNFPTYYLLIHQYDQLYHTLIPRDPKAFLKNDFENLESMDYVNKVYTNGELDLWMIYADKAP